MVTREDVESFLLRLEDGVEEVEPGMWVVGSDGERVVVHYSAHLLVLPTNVMRVPKDERRRAELFEKLLQLNASDLVHGAYGVEEGEVILTDTI